MDDNPTENALGFSGSLLIHGPLSKWARRAAVMVAFTAPFLSGIPVAPCLLAAFLYGHVGQAPRRRGRFIVEADGVKSTATGQLLVPRASYSFAFPADDGERASVCFVGHNAIVAELMLETPADRNALLARLESGASSLRIEGMFGPEVRACVGAVGAVLGLGAFAFSARVGSAAAMIVSALVMVASVLALLQRDARVGQDGVWIAAPFRRWWVSFDELHGVSKVGWWLRLHTSRGDIDLTTPLLWPAGRAGAARRWLLSTLRAAGSRYESLPSSTTYDLRRGDREVPDEGAFRELPLTSADLLDIVENPRSRPRHRVRAAAALLGAAPTTEHVERVRIAAAGCASPELEQELVEALPQSQRRCPPQVVAPQSSGL